MEVAYMVLILECVIICFILLVSCVIAIANGIHNAAFLFEKDVQDRVVEMGLVTKEELERNRRIVKWLITIVGNPLIAAAIAGMMLLFFR